MITPIRINAVPIKCQIPKGSLKKKFPIKAIPMIPIPDHMAYTILTGRVRKVRERK
jgi:hypothetical protein